MSYTDKEAADLLAKLTPKTKFSNKKEHKIIEDLTKQVLTRCSWDLRFFIENFLNIQDAKTDEIVPFVLNKAQRRLLAKIHRTMRKRGGGFWIVVSKARQQGITTLSNAIEVWRGFFQQNMHCGITANKEDTAKKNLKGIKDMIATAPWWFKERCMEWDKGQQGKHLDSSTHLSFKSLITDSEVSFKAFTASPSASRGEALTDLHWTEVAFYFRI